jgi:hypothetical protein
MMHDMMHRKLWLVIVHNEWSVQLFCKMLKFASSAGCLYSGCDCGTAHAQVNV